MLYSFDNFILDTQRYELRRAGQPIPLEPQVFKVLTYLVQHYDRVVPRQELFERLWPGQYVSDDALGRCIRKARQAFGDRREAPRFIKTLPRHGYHFIAPVTVQTHDAHACAPLTASLSLPALPPTSLAASARVAPAAPVFDEEYKQVTVLCGVMSAVADANTQVAPEMRYRLLQACYTVFHELVQQHAGTVLYFGDEGFQALFGAPIAQEDHARRAVIVGLKFQQGLRELETTFPPQTRMVLAARMGVHTGLAVVGHLGDEAQPHYTAVGNTTTVATQLRDLATTGVMLISEAVVQFVEGMVRIETHGRVDIAPLPAPLSVFRVCDLIPSRPAGFGRSTRTLSRFVGRARELAILYERLDQAAGGHGQVVAIAGEPGIGKSRLLYEFQRSLPDRSWQY